jgi:hypothetical protein
MMNRRDDVDDLTSHIQYHTPKRNEVNEGANFSRGGIVKLVEKEFARECKMQNHTTKRNVEFQDDNSLILSSGLTENEKSLLWYSQYELDKFKTDAARDAGVRLFYPFATTSSPSSNETSEVPEAGGQKVGTTKDYTNKFVVVGNFDDKAGEDVSVITDAATCNSQTGKCTNEYNDTINDQGEEVCKRGLGFHFSRIRKCRKAWIRASVLAWARKMNSILLEKDSNRDLLPRDIVRHLDAERLERSMNMLAMLSSKCTKDERRIALWRGRMDYEVAYRENSYHTFTRIDSNSSESLKTLESESKKRAVGDEYGQKSKKRITM